jgi:hypothetical protein
MTTFENPAASPPQVSRDDTLAAFAPGLVSGSGSLSLELTSSPGSVSADVRIFAYGFGTYPGPTSSLGSPPPPDGPPAELAYVPGSPLGSPAKALGWWLVQESTLTVGTPVAFAVPAGAVPLVVLPAEGVSMVPAGTNGGEVPGYDPGTRFYTAAGTPQIARWPDPSPPTPLAVFVALISPVAGDYEFSVS